jgi:hypothetical protein
VPSNRKRTRRQSQAEPWRVEFMLHGCVIRPDGTKSPRPFMYEREYDCCFADHRALRPAWEAARDELLPQWIKEHPGTRPFAWRGIDAPEPRLEGETEIDYLKRHHFLTKSEEKLLKNQI